MTQCRTCFGTYHATAPDGLTYYHACPPLSEVEMAVAVAQGAIVLAKDETIPQALRRRLYARPMARDENLIVVVVGELPRATAAGLGVVTVNDATIDRQEPA